MRLGDVIIFEQAEGVITYINNDYIECTKREVNSFEIKDNDWFSLYFFIVEKGLKTLYFGSKTPIKDKEDGEEISVLTNSVHNFLTNENRTIKEGKIYNVVTRKDSKYRGVRFIIDRISDDTTIEITLDTLKEEDEVTFIIDVFDGISIRDTENEILDFVELEDDNDSDSDDEKDKVGNVFRYTYEQRIPNKEKQLSDDEKKDQITFDLHQHFDWTDDETTYKKTILNIYNETFVNYDSNLSVYTDWYKRLNSFTAHQIYPKLLFYTQNKLNEGDIIKQKERYNSNLIHYNTFLETLFHKQKNGGGSFEVLNDVISVHDKEYIQLLSNYSYSVKDISKSTRTNTITKSQEVKGSADSIEKPITYVLDKTSSDRLPPTVSNFSKLSQQNPLDIFSIFDTNINDIPFSYLFDLKNTSSKFKIQKNQKVEDNPIFKYPTSSINKNSKEIDNIKLIQAIKLQESSNLTKIKNDLEDYKWDNGTIWPKKHAEEYLIKKHNITKEFSSFIVNRVNTNNKTMELDSNHNNFIENYNNSVELQNRSSSNQNTIELKSFKRTNTKQNLEDSQSLQINKSANEWNKLDNMPNKLESSKLKLQMIFEGKFVRSSRINENPYYFYDLDTKEPTIPRHWILKLLMKVSQSSNDKHKFTKYRDCLLNQWCLIDDDKYYSIINDELILSSLDDDHGFGENASFTNNTGQNNNKNEQNDQPNVHVVQLIDSLFRYLHISLQSKINIEGFGDNFIDNAVKLCSSKLMTRIEWQTYMAILKCKKERINIQTQVITEKIASVFTQSNIPSNKVEGFIKKWVGMNTKKNVDEKIKDKFLSLVVDKALTDIIHKQVGLLVSSYLFYAFNVPYETFNEILSNTFDKMDETSYNGNLRWIYGYGNEIKKEYKESFVKSTLRNYFNSSIQYWNYNKISKKTYNYPKVKYGKKSNSKTITISSALNFHHKKSTSSLLFAKNETSTSNFIIPTHNQVELSEEWDYIDISQLEMPSLDIFNLDEILSETIDNRCYKKLILRTCGILLTSNELIQGKKQFKLPTVWSIYKSKNFQEKISSWIKLENEPKSTIHKLGEKLYFVKMMFKDEILNFKKFIDTSSLSNEKYKILWGIFVKHFMEKQIESSDIQYHEYMNIMKMFFKSIFEHVDVICGTLTTEKQNLDLVADQKENEASDYISKETDDKNAKALNKLEKNKHLAGFAKGALNQASGESVETVELEDYEISQNHMPYESVDGQENLYEED
tara:strand:- start:2353 stop:6060 length:3708 start_codon:yes stop_codon:yes gene_type:complete